MAKRRGKIDLNIELDPDDKIIPPTKGGDDFDYCTKIFFDELDLKNLSYHTKRWHRENLTAYKKVLQQLGFPTEPINIRTEPLKQCILYWKRDAKLSPTTINHRIRSMKQFLTFLY
ncbi:MAG: Phage integrase, N-terminal SAM-like domain [Peptococcaceae bacterium]|nr:Phage integrase, N-terminal SAM-like domain [Peptococcaceae bacterium]